ncbi:MAG: epoxyqueuosine reductase [Spirochaetae bacterium HGW-Spirochaetae-5]|nr:MAG: epoxyqueuosine reductase [Spirochaetae bacterium HGW-Spirochaetae-5]
MISRADIIAKAEEIGFEDIGFTGIEPFTSQLEFLRNPDARYGWTEKIGLTLEKNTDPLIVLEDGKSLIVLLHSYLQSAIPVSLMGNFGRCYLNDDRVTRDGLALRVKEFRIFLKENGINSKLSPAMPDKLAAARAGVGTFGKNCLLYASRGALKSSFIFPIVIVVDAEFEADTPSVKTDCPHWCRNACIAACPTRALLGNGKIDSQRCISYLTYHGKELTPLELREPMGMYIYGCDRCQNVCPRNTPRLSLHMPDDEKLADMSEKFSPEKLLAMDKAYFETFIWPRMFYMSYKTIWKWKMNAARAMGNSLDRKYIPHLIRAVKEEDDERVRAMAAWSLGKLGGDDACSALREVFTEEKSDMVKEEITGALEKLTV